MENEPNLNQTDARDLIAQALSRPSPVAKSVGEINIHGIEVIEQIGQGGMGEVYMGVISDSDEVVAIKLLNPSADGDPLGNERFIREGETLNRLNHPNLLKVKDRGQLSNGRPYLITDYMEGGTLERITKGTETVSDSTVIQLLQDLCAGLSAVHQAGLVHRDIKPSNLLIDENRRLVIGDFGLAKSVQMDETELTLSGSTLGTASYMAPEQSEPNQTVGASSDIFSTGVVLYQLLTKSLPKGQFKPPSAFGRNRNWNAIITRCLATAPEDRFQNATELGEAIEKLSPSRRKLLVGSCALVATGIAGGFASKSLLKEEEWKNILPEFRLSPTWTRNESGHLICSGQTKGSTVFTQETPGDTFEIKGAWTRHNGVASLALFFITSKGAVSFEMGAWQQNLIGIQLVDGRSLRDPGSNPKRQRIANGVSYQFQLSVTPETVKFRVGETEFHEVSIAEKVLQREDTWINSTNRGIGIGSWKSRAEISLLEVKRG